MSDKSTSKKTKKELIEENEALKAEIVSLKQKISSLESEVYSRLTDRELVGSGW